jgi:hypothetical protein
MKTATNEEKQMGVTKISLRLIGALIIAIAVIAGCEADSPNHPIASDSGTYDGQLLMVKKSDGPIGHISPTSLTDDSLLALINQNPPLSSSALRDILMTQCSLPQ